MKSIVFIFPGIILGLFFALFDTAVSNTEVSAINPGIHDLIGKISPLKFLVYMGIGAAAGFALYIIILRLPRRQ
jgi:membrane protein insertase Oxa1/YidC/SpoIIIJ